MKTLFFISKRHIVLLLLLISKAMILFAQDFQKEKEVNYQNVFTEIKTATKKAKCLWHKDLYTSILLVDPKTRLVVANNASSGLKLQNGSYIGQLPENINIANTAVEWNGKMWAMIILPLPDEKFDRINLITHELFHKAQAELGFKQEDPINNHLDKIEGRIYLTLELIALKKALLASNNKEQHRHILNALTFRKYRHHLFSGSDSTENKLELNEGITEYTAFMVANRSNKAAVKHFISDMKLFIDSSSFVRSFPFHTIPLYGFLLNKTDRKWNNEINPKTDLTNFLIHKFNYQSPGESIETISKEYGYNTIFENEKKREAAIIEKIAFYKNEFINTACLKLVFEKMNVSFNPSNIIPLDSLGTVYPTIRVTDNWGILEVTKGALISPNWDYIMVPNVATTDSTIITGDGWTLKLTDNYRIAKDSSSRYILIKR